MTDFEGQLESADVIVAAKKYIALFLEQATPSALDEFLRHACAILERGCEENRRRKKMARAGRLKRVCDDATPSKQGSGDRTRGDTWHVPHAGAQSSFDH